ncbi:hypothetical protein Sps_04875 [Shewanella psychrophila]|uniref:Transposase n=3 Tax=Shewanella TaxID=22 RepID=A0A1S6HWK6_9GAMM|nr:hypothetical protein Sps_04875 [Shewanella psychrophila]
MASRKHKTLEQWLELIELHKQSKLTIVDFCSQHHLVVKTFSRKRSELMKAKEAFHSTFVKLTPKAEALATEPPQEVAVINLAVGAMSLTLPLNTDPRWLGQLLRECR